MSRVEELLEAILEELKAQRQQNVSIDVAEAPYYPAAPIFIDPHDHTRNGGYPGSPLPVPVYTEPRCGRCGITISGMVGYVCADPKCPSGLGPVTARA